jgi:hypothetical protein
VASSWVSSARHASHPQSCLPPSRSSLIIRPG